MVVILLIGVPWWLLAAVYAGGRSTRCSMRTGRRRLRLPRAALFLIMQVSLRDTRYAC
jgi:hypothetical protein